MKIVKFKDFLMLPLGTLFSFKYSDCINDLCIKRDTILNNGEPIDFMYESLIEDNRPSGTHHESLSDMGDKEWEYTSCTQRDGMFDDTAEYIIFDGIDVRLLVNSITDTRNGLW